ncbi:hypothetical protein TKK_0013839 [Trichogramma kaykai]|uniref:Chromo domain-containing protein n=1 Tax=Trichogramma kaykai TaxID=54128 RepID=A0ABD2WHN9_9HYME
MSSFEKIYFLPTHPAAYAGANRLKRSMGKRYTGNTISSWLEQHDAYNLHTPVIRKFPRRCYNIRNIDDVWEADLIDWRSLKTYNDGYMYLLVIIDALSKYAWVEPLKDKSAKTVSKAFERVFQRSRGRLPVLLQTDKGKEFISRETLTLFKKKNIQHRVVRNPDIKAAIAERFIRTLKERIWRYFTHHRTRRFLDVLPKIVQAYNNTVHSSIKMTPVSVNLNNAALARKNLENRYKLPPSSYNRRKKLKYKIGDLVRISRAKNAFAKGYEGGWTIEIFKIKHISEARQPAVYYVEDLAGEPIDGFFYEQELTRVRKNLDTAVFEVEKILDTKGRGRNKKYLVHWRGYPDKFDSWEPAISIERQK